MSYPPSDQPPYGGQPPFGGQPPYGSAPPPPGGGGPMWQNPYGGAYGPPPPNNLVWGIVTTVLCCLPLGIASIVYASQVNSKWAAGDAPGAYAASEKAKKFAIWGAVIGGIVAVVYVLLLLSGIITNSTTSF